VQITNQIKEQVENARENLGSEVVLLVSPMIRMHLAAMLRRKIEDLYVISFAELDDDIPLEVVGIIHSHANVTEESFRS
ncbi:MAG: hypothetical protein D6820_00880, partial [Lentisphaerae bacterium]